VIFAAADVDKKKLGYFGCSGAHYPNVSFVVVKKNEKVSQHGGKPSTPCRVLVRAPLGQLNNNNIATLTSQNNQQCNGIFKAK